MFETFFNSPLSFSTCSFFFALVTAMFDPFPACVARALLPAQRGQECPRHTKIYAFAAVSTALVSIEMPGPIDELR